MNTTPWLVGAALAGCLVGAPCAGLGAVVAVTTGTFGALAYLVGGPGAAGPFMKVATAGMSVAIVAPQGCGRSSVKPG